MYKLIAFTFNKLKNYVDWPLLLFLLLFLNVKVPVKIIAIAFIYIIRFNFKFNFNLARPRLPLFYGFIIPLAFVALLINSNYHNSNYLLVFCTGIGFWVLAILAAHQVKLSVERAETEQIYHTIIVFFILNALLSVLNLVLIMWRIGDIDPYSFRGLNETYFVNTGDNIKGLTFDISSTNAILCAFGVVFFLFKRNFTMVFVCMSTLLLTYNNLINLVFVLVLLYIFIFNSTRQQKSIITLCFALFAIFMVKVSPQNSSYVQVTFKNLFHKYKPFVWKPPVKVIPLTQRPDSVLTPEERKQKTAQLYLDSVSAGKISLGHRALAAQNQATIVNKNGGLQINNIDTNLAQFRVSFDTLADQKVLLDFIKLHKANLPLASQSIITTSGPGKVLGILQTITFLSRHPAQLIAGSGIGTFSSKIAFRALGIGLRGNYPSNHTYINPNFLTNHVDLYLSFFSKDAGLRSVTNNPSSVYDQLLAEYGLMGFAALVFFYLGFFAKHYQGLTYGLPLLMFVAAMFFVDYWFEQLSVLVMFELMMFLNIKETELLVEKADNYAKS